MFGKILSKIGSIIGNKIGSDIFGTIGGGILSTISRVTGSMLGNYIERSTRNKTYKKKFIAPTEYTRIKNLHDSFTLNVAHFGHPIPLIFGSARISGKIIWCNKINKKHDISTIERYFPRSDQVKSIHKITEYKYYLSFAVCICEGVISEISKIWAFDDIMNLSEYNHRIYYGTDDQMPDPLLSESGLAFRGIAYIVFEDMPLYDFGNTIPSLSFEVVRKPNVQNKTSVENMIESIIMIPGSGEYVYDTEIQYKIIDNTNNIPINSHNELNIANSKYSLSQLRNVCPNVKWIGPVVCWFGDNMDIKYCSIKPAIEYDNNSVKYSEDWSVYAYTRDNARVISRLTNGDLSYGGSVSDVSVLRYIVMLKEQGFNVMFYPMFLMDVRGKPWRGHITGRVEDVHNFFNKEDGYNVFILHYANLVKDYIDAFIIGSELIGLTSITDGYGYFPVVDELVKLAIEVKNIVGSSVLVSYAADWSEYHHTKNGWYNLDSLWACKSIDFVGIDAYFPVTSTSSSYIDYKDIIYGFQSGEGYEYYEHGGNRHKLEAQYAWKNIRYWWENTHCNPNGVVTDWVARSKKIWFTEFGFPSIDKATNRPNIFYDPLCDDGGVPDNSSGSTDFSVQRKAIKAFIEYWKTQEYIENMFLWTWDARPYPAWPHMNIWHDGNLWEKGHWVNDKFGITNLSDILLELSTRCGISETDVSSVDEVIDGLVYENQASVMHAINYLRIAYFFDILSSCGKSIFVKRGTGISHKVSNDEIVKLDNSVYIEYKNVAQINIISKVSLFCINNVDKHSVTHCYVNSENDSNMSDVVIRLPLLLSETDMKRLGQLILKNAMIENHVIKFAVPISYLLCKPSDFIVVIYLGFTYHVRIVALRIIDLKIEITGIADNVSVYHMPLVKLQQKLIYSQDMAIKLVVLDLPLLFNRANSSCLHIFLQSSVSQELYISLDINKAQYYKITTLQHVTTIGRVISFDITKYANIFVIDNLSNIVVYYKDLHLAINNKEWNVAMCGNEIIQFQSYKQIDDNMYQISNIIRGVFATEDFLFTHSVEEIFVLLDSNCNILPISRELELRKLNFKVQNINSDMVFYNMSQKLMKPFIKEISYNNGVFNVFLVPRSCDSRDKISTRVIVSSNNVVLLRDISDNGYHMLELNITGGTVINVNIVAFTNNNISLERDIVYTVDLL